MPKIPFAPGNSGGPGRGNSRNRLQTKFLYDLAQDWEANGSGVIRIVRIEDPARYLSIVAALMPREILLKQSALSELPDEELAYLLERLQTMVRLANSKEVVTPALPSPDSVH